MIFLPGYQLLQLSLDIDTVDILMFSVKRKTRLVKNMYSKIVTQQFKHPRRRHFKRSHGNIDNDDAPLYQVPCHQPRLDMMDWYTICAEKNNKQITLKKIYLIVKRQMLPFHYC